jgi:hypothetical protein
MQGIDLFNIARDGDRAIVRTLLSSAGAQSLINYQEEMSGSSPLQVAAGLG